MSQKDLKQVLGKGASFFSAFLLCLSSMLMNFNLTSIVANDVSSQAKPTPPSLAKPNEVRYNDETTAVVSNGSMFESAFRNANISRIILSGDIDISNQQVAIRTYDLNRSLQIDGNGHLLISTSLGETSDLSLFSLDALPINTTATFHLKNLKVWTRGTNYIDNGSWLHPRSEGWQLILEDIDFQRNNGGLDRAKRVARLGQGHVFFRGNVQMITSGENIYAGQITVEPHAEIYGENDHFNYSNWWFSENNANLTSVDSTLNIGEGAYVNLVGTGGTGYPAIYEHFRAINVHPGATLKATKPGNAYAFHNTPGMTDKYINVFEGARIEGTSTGTGVNPILDEKASSYMTGHFYAAPQSIVKFIGESNTPAHALVNLRNDGSTFELDQPAEYDIRNNLGSKRSGAKAVDVGPGSKFVLTSSDIEVWDTSQNPKDLGKAPDYSWYQASVVADSNGTPLTGTKDPHNTLPSLQKTWDTTKYARITGINDRPALSFDELTDADKSYTVHASVLGKPAWWENQVTIHVTNDDSSDVQDGSNDKTGNFTYILPNDAFFKAGTTYTASGYRGVPAWSSVNTATVTVRDVTPPKPVSMSEPIYQTSDRIQGIGGEPGATVSITVNDQPISSIQNKNIVASDGSWSFLLANDVYLRTGDVIQVFLTDENGNTTPAQTTAFKDAIFEAATKAIVQADNIAPILSVQQSITYNKGQTIDEAQFLKDVHPAMNKPIDKIKSDFLSVVNMDKVGVYRVNVAAYDRAGNASNGASTIVIIKDDNTVVDSRHDVVMYAHDFTLKLSDVPSADFIALAGAEAWELSTATPLEVKLTSDKPTIGGQHIINFQAGQQTRKVTATIIDNVAPILFADAQIIYNQGEQKDESSFLQDVHAHLNEEGIISSNFTDVVNLQQVGVYIVSLGGTDIAGNEANTVKTAVLVKDNNTVIDLEHEIMLQAQDFTINLSEVPHADFIQLADAKAWRLGTAEPIEVVLITTKPTFSGKHQVLFQVVQTLKAVTATVIDDVPPSLAADTQIIYEEGANKNEAKFFADIHAKLNEPGTITSDFAEVVNLNRVGVYIVRINAQDLAGNASNTIYTNVLVKDANTVIDQVNGTMIQAHDFKVRLSKIPSADFVKRARAKAWNIKSGKTIEVILASDKPSLVGEHEIFFKAEQTRQSVIVTVIDDVAPILEVDALVIYTKGEQKSEAAFLVDINAEIDEVGIITSDFEQVVKLDHVGVYVTTINAQDTSGNASNTEKTIVLVKDEYTEIDLIHDTMLQAHDFSVALSEVPEVDFIELAGAKAWQISTSASINVIQTSEKPTTGGVHEVTFKAGETENTVKATVIDDVAPMLFADARIIYDQDTKKDEAGFLEDIHARLNESGTITSDFADAVNMHQVGAYVVSISGQDTAGNVSNGIKTIVLIKNNDTIIDLDDDIMLYASDFTLKLSEVPEANFVKLANAHAWKMTTTEAVGVELASAKPTTGGVHKVTFQAGKTTRGVNATIIDDLPPTLFADAQIIYDQDTKKDEAGFLKDIHARLNESGTITSDFTDAVNMHQVGAYVVSISGQDTAGNVSNGIKTIVLIKNNDTIIDLDDDIMLYASDFTLKLSEVPEANFVKLANAHAWKMTTTEAVGVELASAKPTTGGVHKVTFQAGKTTRGVNATIIDDVPPVLQADSQIIYDRGAQKNEVVFLQDVHAKLSEPGKITSDFTNIVDFNQVGVYVVSLDGVDTAGNGSNSIKTTVLIKDSNTIIDADNHIMLQASDFILNLSEVPNADFVKLAKAKAWKITTTKVVNVELVSVKPTTGGVHEATFKAEMTTKSVNATIIDDVPPLLQADSQIIYDKGIVRNEENFLFDVHARLNEPGTVVSDFAKVVALNQVGVYVVSITGKDTAGNPANTIKTIVLIKDNDTVIDAKNATMIQAYNFTIELSEVPHADFVKLAHAQAWQISTSAQVEVQLASTKPRTGGKHEVTFRAGKARKTVIVDVHDNVPPVLRADSRIIYQEGVNKDEAEFLAEVHATLDESGTITSDFDAAVNLNQVGAYIVTIHAQDVAGNPSNSVEIAVIVTDDNTVIDQAHDTMVQAHNFTVKLSKILAADFVKLARAKAWRMSTGEILEVVLASEKPMIVGQHDVLFMAGQTTKPVIVTVIDNVDPIIEADTLIIYDKGSQTNAAQFLTDVHAEIDEAGTITSDFSNVVNLNSVGVYVVSIVGTDTSGNMSNIVKTIVLVKDKDTIIDLKHNTMLQAHDFTLKLSEVADADFGQLADATAWQISTNEKVKVELISTKPVTGGRHEIIFQAGKTKKAVIATVIDDVPPLLQADSQIIYDKGILKDEAAFLLDVHARLNEPGMITSDFAKVVDFMQVGAYAVSIRGEDTSKNISNSVKTIVLIKDDNTVIEHNEDIMLYARDFTVKLSEVPNADFVALAKAKAWDVTTAEAVKVERASAKPATGGVHEIILKAGKTATIVMATIIDDVPPILQAKKQIIYAQGTLKDEVTFLQDVHAILNEPGTITSDFANAVNMQQVGAYVVSIRGKDVVENVSNIVKTIVLVKDDDTNIDFENDTMMRAHDFKVLLSAVPEADFVQLADAMAWRISTTEPVKVNLVSAKPTVGGEHDVIFVADKTKKAIKAIVIDDVPPILLADEQIIYEQHSQKEEAVFLQDVHAILNEPGTITSDFADVVNMQRVGAYVVSIQGKDDMGNVSNLIRTIVLIKDADTIVDTEEGIMLQAHNFTVKLSDVLDADFVQLAEGKAWDVRTAEAVPVNLASVKPTTGGEHEVVFHAGITIKVVKATVIDNVPPVLRADAEIIYDKGIIKNEENYLFDVHARLNELGTITSDFEKVVDLNKVGAYMVSIYAKDAFGNRSNTVNSGVLVRDGDTEIDQINGMMLHAVDFTLKLSEVATADFVLLGQAKAWKLATAEPVNVELASRKPTTAGVHEVIFRANQTTKIVKVTVIDDVPPVLQADAQIIYVQGTQKNEGSFLQDVHARLNEAGTIRSNFAETVNLNKVGIYIVDIRGQDAAGNISNMIKTIVLVKDDHSIIDGKNNIMLQAHDFTIKLSDVPAADFVLLAQAKAWEITTAQPIPVELVSLKPTTAGRHEVILRANKAVVGIYVTVIDNVPPVLQADRQIIYNKGITKNDARFLLDIHARLNEPGIITSDFSQVVNLNQVGAYVVNINGKDTAGNESNTVIMRVLVKDDDTTIDHVNDVMLYASDFKVKLSKVLDADFVRLAHAKAWRMSTGDVIEVVLASEKPTIVGVHDVSFKADKSTKTVRATIIDNVAPILEADTLIIYDKGIQKSESQFLADVNANLDEPGTMTTDFIDKVNLQQVGAYVVTINGHDIAGNVSNSVKTTILVKDEHTVIDPENDTMMQAHDFIVNLSEVPLADFVVLAEARAWHISTSEPIEVSLLSDKPILPGKHVVNLQADKTLKAVMVTVIDDTIIFEASDVNYFVSEFNEFKANGGLAEETVKRAKAKAYLKETGENVEKLVADVTEMLAAEVKGGEIFDVLIYIEEASKSNNNMFLLLNAEDKISDEVNDERPEGILIKVSIDLDEATALPSLPTTGEDMRKLETSVLILMGSSLMFCIAQLYCEKEKNKREHS